MAKPRQPFRRLKPLGVVEQAKKLGDSIKFSEIKDENFHKRWLTEKHGAVRAPMGLQIGGQEPMRGPDILKFIKKHDPNNTSGAVKDSLDIMLKLQEATYSNSLFTSIQPLQNILGGGLYGKMKSAGSSTKIKKKTQDSREEQSQQEDSTDIIDALIAAAMAMIPPEDAELAAELLNSSEIQKISDAYYNNGVYSSSTMPVSFVNAINYLIPIFRSTKGAV